MIMASQRVVRLDLSKILSDRRMTQKSLAKKSGVSENAISSLCSGTRGVRFETLSKIADALNVSVHDLIVEEEI